MSDTGPSDLKGVTQPRRERPLSPHLQVYKPQLTTILSITHRATGIALTIGLLLFSWWIIGLWDGKETFASVQNFLGTLVGSLMLIGWIWALFFHLCNGIRHLLWDAGYGFSLEATYRGGWVVVILPLVLTVLTMAGFMVFGNLLENCHDGC